MNPSPLRAPWFQRILIIGLLAAPAAISATKASGQTAPVALDARFRLEPDSLTVRGLDSTYGYAVADIDRAEVSQERRSHRRTGAIIGGVVGAGATFLALNAGGSTSLCDQSANQDAASAGLCISLYVLGGLAGAGLGALAGGLITVESAHDVPVESLRVGIGLRLIH